ncbi:hypothetical protein [Ciceribacter selenitireducens]|uniref:Uncharacterized protein n=1 Tax=Ciceribacter selenitireducens ATCC BAA-1503 TaxID=1336235 RepID=A0A376AIY0_9HYPH|nr:hypothetical protein [Ciceribacter selenitireducens]SSC67765.1 unnamed protein product [Ciceribacter selenitireducens ATCC BAA-1503]
MTTRLKALIFAINISILLWGAVIGSVLWLFSDAEVFDRRTTASISDHP